MRSTDHDRPCNISSGMKLNRNDLEKLCDALKAKALHEQMERRRWQQRAIQAEKLLAIYEGGDQ